MRGSITMGIISLIIGFLILTGMASAATPVTSCGVTISSPGVYELQNDIFDNSAKRCIHINTSNVIFDGQGHTLDGIDSPSQGIRVNNPNFTLTNVTVKNLTITDWRYGILYLSVNNGKITDTKTKSNRYGIYLSSSSNNILTNNIANSNTQNGISLAGTSNYNTLENNNAHFNNYYGIYITSSSNNALTNNNAGSNTYYGIYLNSSNSNTLTGNTANSNNRGIYLSSSNSNILTGNNASSNAYQGIYLSSSSGNVLQGNTAQENAWFDFYIWASSDTDCNNEISGTAISGGRDLLYYNSSVGLFNVVASELVLCNADNSNINNVTIMGSDVLDNNGILLMRTDFTTISNSNSSNNAYGMDIESSNNNTIQDNTVSNNMLEGIYTYNSSNTITGNTANSNSRRGISLELSSGNTIMNNNASSNNRGIYLLYSSDNTLTSNTVSSNTYQGIHLDFSGSNTLTGNTMSLNTYNFWIDGNAISDFVQTIYASNTVDGKPMHYHVGISNAVMDSTLDIGYIGIVNGVNVTVRDLTLTKNGAGVLLINTTDSLIENVTVTDNYGGMYLAGSNGNTLKSNNINSNMQYGIYLRNSPSVITDNIINSNGDMGVHLYKSNSSTLANNIITSNGQYGIYLESANNNIITNNTANSNIQRGISLWSSSNNTITDNTANLNNRGINLAASSNSNTLTDNTVNSNTYQGILLGSSTGNILTNNIAQENAYYDVYVWASTDAGCNNEISGMTISGGRSFLYYTNTSVSLNDVVASELVLCNADYSSINNVTIVGSDILDNNGILLVRTDFTTISNSSSSNNADGINIKSSNNNTITGNIASGNSYWGFYLYSSNDNLIYNNYLDNVNNAHDDGVNDWNTTKTAGTNIIGGSFFGGNYWSDYTGADTDSDGIGDTALPYNAGGNITNTGDWLPLVTPPTQTTYNLSLSPGWNLISLPIVPENTSLTSVLASIDGNYSVVYGWIGGGWKRSTDLRDPLTEIVPEYGYWIYMTAPDTLELTGTVPVSTTINILAGWNLVGYPSLTSGNLTAVLSSINYSVVYSWIGGGWKRSTDPRDPLTTMDTGYGYWIYATDAGSYEVRN